MAQEFSPLFERKLVRVRLPWRLLPPALWFYPFAAVEGGALQPPWPFLVIASGRACVPLALALKKEACRVIFLQDPRIEPALFDWVIAPHHDGLQGPNVLSTLGGLHSLTQEKLRQAKEQWHPFFQIYPRPWVSLLLGGDSPHYRYTLEDIRGIAHSLKASQGTLLVTPSRRTRSDCLEVLKEELQGASHWIWDGKGDNPYLGLLALSDSLIVTADSVSMACEACFTGLPVYILPLPIRSRKLCDFHQELIKGGYARWWEENPLQPWSPNRLDERARILPILKKWYKEVAMGGFLARE